MSHGPNPAVADDERNDASVDGQHMISSAALAEALTALGTVDPVCVEALAALNLRVYPGVAADRDRTGYVVLDVHGVSVGVKRRAANLYLHVDTTETDDRVIAFEVNDTGETDHDTFWSQAATR